MAKITPKSAKFTSPRLPSWAKKFNLLEFIGAVKVELAKVSWPSHQKTLKLTFIVTGVSIVIGIYIGGLDILFTGLIQAIINR